MKRKPLCALVASLLLTSAFTDISLAAPVTPQTTAFSYQGQLNAGGIYPTGQYQFTFTLYDAATGGAVVSGTSPIPQSLQVINGLFTTDLDFGQVFNGTQYWLDIQVGTLDTNEEELVARQPIDVVPVAQFALNSPAGTAGPTGATGPQGADGAQGPQGPAGQNGDTGPQGAQGPQGAAGNDGAQGPQGSIGPTGATGLNWQGTWSGATAYNVDDAVFFGGSSYIALVANTNDEPDTSVTNSDGNWELLAQQGATGAQGPTGTAGTQGPQGDQGNPGSQGPQGPQGDVGIQGPQGVAGAQGPQGTDGSPGAVGGTGATGPTGTGPNLPAGVARSTTVTQTFPVANAFLNVHLMSSSYLSGITLGPTSAFIVNQAGVYRVSYIATPKSSTAVNVTVSARVMDNLVVESDLSSTAILLGNESGVLTAEDILPLNVGDSIQLQMSASTANVVTLPTGSNTSLMLIALDVTP